VRARAEQQVCTFLASKGIETFAPECSERRRYSDRVKCVWVAAFPGYIFSRLDTADRVPLLTTPGVQGLIGQGACPEPIEDATIDALQKAFSRDGRASLVPYLTVGDVVQVLDGPMTGAVGILLRQKAQDRLVISISVLQRSVAVEVDGTTVALVPQKGPVPERRAGFTI
jgi:transcription antitermination factor NusG